MAPKAKQPFTKSFQELEDIAAWFERNDVDLEEGLKKFERGMQLASDLRERLNAAEVKIEQIRKRFGTNVDTPRQ
ncbi:MAG: exodeoxyribonuclease VII small subunit [bacterium]|nr:exodeoxyribonuclease VII small subunit [bacterium]